MMIYRCLFSIVLIFQAFLLFGQKTTVTGRVTDGDTKEGIPFCNVYFKDTSIGVSTDVDGYFSLSTETANDSLTVSAIGYALVSKVIKKGVEQEINFILGASDLTLTEVVVYAGENPANQIVRDIIRNKKTNRAENLDAFQAEEYSKVELDLDNIDPKLKDSKLFKPFAFIFENIDSTSDEKPFLPAYITETVSDVFHVKGEREMKTIPKAQRTSGVDNKTVVDFIGSMHEEYNVYDNWIEVLNKPFASPFSDLGLHYYEYYIIDSAYVSGKLCQKLKFKPKRKQENTFYGTFWVVDSLWAVQRVDMRISPDVNINLVSRVIIYQEFGEEQGKYWLPKRQKTVLDFQAVKNSPGLIGRKTVSFKNYRINEDKITQFYKEKDPEDYWQKDLEKADDFWSEARHEKLSDNEKMIYKMVDSIKNVPIYKTYVQTIQIILTGLIEVGPVEIGSLFSAYSSNRIEGSRFRLGVWTSNQFSKKIRFGGFLAYGINDERWKYGGDFQWNISKYPRITLEGSYRNDITFSHSSSEDLTEGNLFSGFYRRPVYQKLSFAEEAKLAYERYWKKGWSNRLTVLHRKLTPYSNVDSEGNGFNYKFLPNPDVTSQFDTDLATTEIIFKVKYAYKERFLDGAFNRVSAGSDYPIAALQYTAGIKDLLGGDYQYHKLTLSVKHWFNIEPIGWSRYNFKVGKTFGRVPFLLAEVPTGNEGYFYNPNAFNGMNRYEFAMDTYASLMYTHHFDGFILNKIPLIRKLKWRTVAAFRATWGTMTSENLEANQLNLFDPSLDGRVTYTGFRVPEAYPYMEAGVGIENIFKLIRVDALWRLNYLDNPDADRFTFRLGLDFYF